MRHTRQLALCSDCRPCTITEPLGMRFKKCQMTTRSRAPAPIPQPGASATTLSGEGQPPPFATQLQAWVLRIEHAHTRDEARAD